MNIEVDKEVEASVVRQDKAVRESVVESVEYLWSCGTGGREGGD